MAKVKTSKHELEYDDVTKQGVFNGGRNTTAKIPHHDPFPSRLVVGATSKIQDEEISLSKNEPIDEEDNTIVLSSDDDIDIEDHVLILG